MMDIQQNAEQSPPTDVAFHTADFPLYRLKMFANLLLATGANSLAFVLIVWASPKQIHVYRWFLLDILMTAFCMDLYFMAVLQPYALLPVPGYCALGLTSFGGTFFGGFIGLLILFFCLGCCGGAVLSAAAYRLLAVYNLHEKMVTPLGIGLMIGLHLLISSPVQVAAGFVIYHVADQQAMRVKIYEIYPEARELLNSSEICVFALMEGSDESVASMRRAVYIAIGVLSLVGIAGLSIIALGFASLIRRKSKISARLYRMHRQLSFSLICQLFVPGIMLYVPFCVVAISLFYHLSILRDLTQIYADTFSMHSTLNAVVMIAFTRPYRQVVLNWLRRRRIVQFLLKKTGNITGQQSINNKVAAVSSIGTELGIRRSITWLPANDQQRQ